ncbi:hypothetical protein [Microlunatus speluncae]|uniref:hypothetical protein n=1 Tax=Microlunatus speluncae TaxID=2594267 RepID=UPI0012665465|nr:hypothetical protein [Microlunatus speluncae]
MYEMYPDDWSATARTGRRVLGEGDSDGPPRRRPRKEHSVTPPVIRRQQRRDQQSVDPAA